MAATTLNLLNQCTFEHLSDKVLFSKEERRFLASLEMTNSAFCHPEQVRDLERLNLELLNEWNDWNCWNVWNGV